MASNRTRADIQAILSDPSFAPHITDIKEFPEREGSYAPLPEDLYPPLAESCASRGMDRLYSHQAEAYASARTGSHTVIVTPTASGKTLCYNLPVMQTLLEESEGRALYLFPTKALSQDQQSELNAMVGEGSSRIPLRVCVYDGDTPQSLRQDARDKGRIIISNPDMIHAGILPNHPKWIRFFASLKFIVIDEMPQYRGIFGSHMANLLRRLLRIARFYGSDPVCILCSATIGNPKELAERLIGSSVRLIDTNGSPSGKKTVVLYNPPLVDSVQGIRRSVMNESQRWALALLRANIKTILFAHSRVRTEVISSYINDSLKNIFTSNEHITVVPYRSGLLPLERRAIEKGLRDGTIQGVVSTNALELGIDIGGLDAAIIAGFPGSFSSFWQQAGRAGRRQTESLAVCIASASPLDQYIMAHPDYFFDRPQETACIDPDNPYILTDHIKCAAFELPFTDSELSSDSGFFPKDGTGEILAFLEEDGILRHTGGRWHWSDRSYPGEAVSLRSATADNVVIVDATKGANTIIGEMDRPSARELLFPNAIYIHLGRQYVVTTLDIPNRRAIVEETEVNYYTDAVVKTDIKVLSEDDHRTDANTGIDTVVGDLLVRTQVAKFKKIRFHTHENIGFGEISLDAEERETRGLMILLGREPGDEPSDTGCSGYDELDEAAQAEVLSGIGTIVKSVAPFFLLCDRRDIGITARIRDPHFGKPALYIYDSAPGGSGLSEALAEKLSSVFSAAGERTASCACESGCPSCIGVDSTGSEIKRAACEMLALLSGMQS